MCSLSLFNLIIITTRIASSVSHLIYSSLIRKDSILKILISIFLLDSDSDLI